MLYPRNGGRLDPVMTERPSLLREMAERCRKLADTVTEPQSRAELLSRAADYEKRAKRAENQP